MNLSTQVTRGAVFRLWRRAVVCSTVLTRSTHGSSLVEFGLMLPFLALLLLGVIDFGRAYYLSIEVANAAQTGAMYGAHNLTDTTGMKNAATGDAPDVPGISATASYGCECSDLSGTASVNCATQPTCDANGNVVNFVLVTTSATYKTLFPWPGIPSSLALQGSAKVRAGN